MMFYRWLPGWPRSPEQQAGAAGSRHLGELSSVSAALIGSQPQRAAVQQPGAAFRLGTAQLQPQVAEEAERL